MYRIYCIKLDGKIIYLSYRKDKIITLQFVKDRILDVERNTKRVHSEVFIYLNEVRKNIRPIPTLEVEILKSGIYDETSALLLKRKAIYNLVRNKGLELKNNCSWTKLCKSDIDETLIQQALHLPKTYNFNRVIETGSLDKTKEDPWI
jgi:hypothetical protein